MWWATADSNLMATPCPGFRKGARNGGSFKKLWNRRQSHATQFPGTSDVLRSRRYEDLGIPSAVGQRRMPRISFTCTTGGRRPQKAGRRSGPPFHTAASGVRRSGYHAELGDQRHQIEVVLGLGNLSA
jgi:hypothetical protein